MRLPLTHLVLGLVGPAALTAQTTAIVNANVVDVRAGTVRPKVTVLIRQGRIAAIGAADSLTVPSGAERIDAHNGFLIPGLADLHAHFKRPEELTVLLSYGVTLVQYLNAFPEMLDWRDRVASGEVEGPELHPCIGGISRVKSADQARQIVANAVEDGFDCIKPYDDFTEEGYRALIEESRRRHVRTVSHIPRNLTWQQALAARPDAIAHAEEFLYSPINSTEDFDSVLTRMKTGGIAMIATLTDYDIITRQMIELPELLAMPEVADYSPVELRLWTARWNHYARDFKIDRASEMRRRLVFQRSLTRALDSVGVTMLLGTDTGNLFVLPGRSVHDELDQLVLSGLTPAAALRAATLEPARFLGREADLGAVEVGKQADLVVVYGNPLRDITSVRLIGGVMRRGHWYSRDSLRSSMTVIRRRFAREREFLADLDRNGAVGALARAARAGYRPDQRALNELAYQLWRAQDDTISAGLVFEANARLHGDDWIAHGSLGEWLASRGQWDRARREVALARANRPRDREMRDLAAKIERRER